MKPEMKIKDFETFKAVYCGVCHTLGKRYSIFARGILSYAATFLAILRLSLEADCPGFGKKRCPFRPLKKCAACNPSPALDFTADITVILFYYKILDNLKDAGFFKRLGSLLLLPFASLIHKKATKRQPYIEKIVKHSIASLASAEQTNCEAIDRAAHPTAALMAEITKFGMDDGAHQRILDRLGYFRGRWFYLIDAAEELPNVLKEGSYFPYAAAYGLTKGCLPEEPEDRIRMLLNSCTYEITAAFGLLRLKRFEPILTNITSLGLPRMQKQVLDKMKKGSHPAEKM